jgi:hypothetical protein
VFHRIDDAPSLAPAAFFMLAARLPAYRGVLRAHLQAQASEKDGGKSPRRAVRPEGNAEKLTGNARTADTAPPATAASLTALNAQLGQTWFSHKVVNPS